MKGYLDEKELESYKKEDLQELAKQLGVDAEGTKKEIAARCAAVEVDIPDDNELTEEDKKRQPRQQRKPKRKRQQQRRQLKPRKKRK
nr:MAG: HeH/LEM domain protein [Bacteriophage sp.]